MPLSPMSAVWMRAQELGQPLMCRDRACGSWPLSARSARRRSSSATAVAAVTLVSTMASLQYSMPVQAMVPRRNTDGRADRPRASSSATSGSTSSLATSSTTIFWCGVVRRRYEPRASRVSASFDQLAAGEPAGERGGADEELAVLLLVHADVVARGGRLGRGGAVGQLVAEVFVLEDLAELLRTPVGQQELQARLGAHAAVAVVAEDAGDAEPDIGGLLRRDERAEALAEHRVGGQRAAHPEVVADAEFGVHHAHQARSR